MICSLYEYALFSRFMFTFLVFSFWALQQVNRGETGVNKCPTDGALSSAAGEWNCAFTSGWYSCHTVLPQVSTWWRTPPWWPEAVPVWKALQWCDWSPAATACSGRGVKGSPLHFWPPEEKEENKNKYINKITKIIQDLIHHLRYKQKVCKCTSLVNSKKNCSLI